MGWEYPFLPSSLPPSFGCPLPKASDWGFSGAIWKEGCVQRNRGDEGRADLPLTAETSGLNAQVA